MGMRGKASRSWGVGVPRSGDGVRSGGGCGLRLRVREEFGGGVGGWVDGWGLGGASEIAACAGAGSSCTLTSGWGEQRSE